MDLPTNFQVDDKEELIFSRKYSIFLIIFVKSNGTNEKEKMVTFRAINKKQYAHGRRATLQDELNAITLVFTVIIIYDSFRITIAQAMNQLYHRAY